MRWWCGLAISLGLAGLWGLAPLAAVAGQAATPAVARAASGWHPAERFPDLPEYAGGVEPGARGGPGRSLACAGDTCWAMSGQGAMRTVSGTPWTLTSIPGPSSSILFEVTAVSCSSSVHCVAVGEDDSALPTNLGSSPAGKASALVTSDGGHTWSESSGVLPAAQLYGVTCVSANRCLAVGTTSADSQNESGTVSTPVLATPAILISADGGATWTRSLAASVLPNGSLHDIACPTGQECWAVGAGESSVPTSGFMSSVISATVVASPTIVATHDGGATWRQVPAPPSAGASESLAAVSCPAAGRCWAVGAAGDPSGSHAGSVIVNVVDGAAGQSEAVPAGFAQVLDSISCPSDNHCWAVGGSSSGVATPLSLLSTSDGQDWTATAVPGFTGDAMSVACSAANSCWSVARAAGGASGALGGVGSELAMLHLAPGSTWKVSPVTNPVPRLTSIACADPNHCVAAGRVDLGRSGTPSAGDAWTQNGGQSWALTTARGLTQFNAVSCPTTSRCIGAGFAGDQGQPSEHAGAAVSADGGRSWTPSSVPTGLTSIDATACPTAGECWAVGTTSGFAPSRILHSTDAGRSWSVQQPPGHPALAALTCVDSSHCWVVGRASDPLGGFTAVILALVSGGWTAEAAPLSIGGLSGVTCGSAERCLVVGSSQASRQSTGSLRVSAGAMASTTDGGKTWTPVSGVPDKALLAAVPLPIMGLETAACAGLSCVAGGAIDTGGFAGWGAMVASRDGGATWTAVDLPALVLSDIAGIACPSPAGCWAVDAGREILTSAPMVTRAIAAAHGTSSPPWWILGVVFLGAAAVAGFVGWRRTRRTAA